MPRQNDVMGSGIPGMAAQAICGTYGNVTATGSNSQANGALAGYAINNVTTAGGADSIVLPTTAQGSDLGDSMVVYTASSTSIKIFPGGLETVNGSTSAITAAQAKMAIFFRTSATNWGHIITA